MKEKEVKNNKSTKTSKSTSVNQKSNKNTSNNKKNNTKNVQIKSNTKKMENKKEVKKNTQLKNKSKQEIKKIEKETEVKEIEKNKSEKAKKTEIIVNNDELSRLIKIILIVTAVFLIFYGITTLVTKNKKIQQLENTNPIIQYDEILLGNLFDQPNNEYYVLVTVDDDQYSSAYSTYLSTYKSKEKAIRFYTSNLDSGFNKSYKSDESKINISNLTELKLKDSTLLKIKNNKIVSAYEGNSKIIEHLKALIK